MDDELVRRVTLDSLAEMLDASRSGNSTAERVLKQALRGAPSLNNSGRATVARRFLGVCALRRRLEFMLESLVSSSLLSATAAGIATDTPAQAERRLTCLVALYCIHEEPDLFVAEPLPWDDQLWFRGSSVDGDDEGQATLQILRQLHVVPWPVTPAAERLGTLRSLPNWLAEVRDA